MPTWTTSWSGGYPNLCYGEWTLFKNGVEVRTDIPFQGEPADTYGTYQRWYFANWMEEFEDYDDGLDEGSWIKEYEDWLKTIASESEWGYIYQAFNENDWRYSSCGGCI